MKEWIDYVSRSYIEAYGQELLLFKLDKTQTKVDELYGEEVRSRIYLPPFKITAVHLDNTWKNVLDVQPYGRTDDKDFDFYLNLNKMVAQHSDLRNKLSCTISIEYVGVGIPRIRKENGSFFLSVGTTTHELEIKTQNTAQKLTQSINAISGWRATLTGNNELVKSIDDFSERNILNSKIELSIKDPTYKNITDVIESGDVVMTGKYVFYEVSEGMPAGNMGWSYSMYNVKSTRADVSYIGLPNQWLERARSKEFKLRDNIYME